MANTKRMKIEIYRLYYSIHMRKRIQVSIIVNRFKYHQTQIVKEVF
jgi:hypothetical protein